MEMHIARLTNGGKYFLHGHCAIVLLFNRNDQNERDLRERTSLECTIRVCFSMIYWSLVLCLRLINYPAVDWLIVYMAN